ncbi:hypothetical protein AB0M43_36425 [Longispora sp. NPDC051575]|uniref:hypothetical protein n=1 Tax=Longispora sp. NPDC051575 TaxID=3154943 RepID=UPI00341C0B38
MQALALRWQVTWARPGATPGGWVVLRQVSYDTALSARLIKNMWDGQARPDDRVSMESTGSQSPA